MKKILLIPILLLLSMVGFAQVQEVMVIEKNDGSKVILDVNDISRVTFENLNVGIVVMTGDATNVTDRSATLCGTIDGVSSIVEVGVIYGTTSTLSERSGTQYSTTPMTNGSYTITLSELSLSALDENTTYYYCAYAKVDGKYYLGEVKSFTTAITITGSLNGYEWVDLGLSSGTKWAVCNVGASQKEQTGFYYSWGDIMSKISYSWKNYRYSNTDGSKFNKYVVNSWYGTVDGRTELQISDDVANYKWGSGWRIPSIEQFEELYNECIWTWTRYKGVEGYDVASKVNNNRIFLPAAGHYSGDVCYEYGYRGFYQSRSLNTSDSQDSRILFFWEDEIQATSRGKRYIGGCVRPVTY